MKKLILALFLMGSSLTLMAQSRHAQLIKKIDELQHAKTYEEFSTLQNDFVDIRVHGQGDTWHPYYYAAYTCIQQAKTQYESGNTAFINGYLNTALKYLFAVYSEEKDNPEINALLGITYYLKSRFDTNIKNQSIFKGEAISYFNKGKEQYHYSRRVILLGDLLGTPIKDQVKVQQDIFSPRWGRADLGQLIKN